MGWPSVRGFEDGVDRVDAATLNRPVRQLAERTEYLYRKLAGHDRTKVVVDATVTTSAHGTPALGQVVYRLPPASSADLSTYALALADPEAGENQWFYADQKAMAVGVVGSTPSGSSAEVVLYGIIDFGASGILASSVIVDSVPTSGRYYLSQTAGKLTASPSGPVIYVCDCQVFQDGQGAYRVRSMLVSPQYRDTGESHIHRSFVLSGSPLGGYSVKTGSRYYVPGIVSGDSVASATALPVGLTVIPYGSWTHTSNVTYTLQVVRSASESTSWSNYRLSWSSSGQDGSGTAPIVFTNNVTNLIPIGTHGLSVRLAITAGTLPEDVVGATKVWTLAMPDAARAWLNYSKDGTPLGFRLNLGMYSVLARYVPPLPENGAALTAGGLELRSQIFGSARRQWRIVNPGTDTGIDVSEGGPWLIWYGGAESADSLVTPFIWNATISSQAARDIVLHANRMRVGPTGFVTSLKPAPGAPIRITSTQTDADAEQGALQIDLDVDFTSSEADVPGCQVVKRISGTEFQTGPVVEKVIAGPGVAVSPLSGQGTVTVSATNAVYAGDFETIALKNAKQDLAGGVFPYTKLLGWNASGQNIASGFTAKFRVPDHIPYKAYRVIVSASVFGETAVAAAATAEKASFSLTNYTLADYACTADPLAGVDLSGTVAAPTPGATAVIPVEFAAGYAAFDPILLHGFDLPTLAQRQKVEHLLLKDEGGDPVTVFPGYFVGLEIARCATAGTDVLYSSQIGFLSLRWNLLEVEEVAE